MSKMSTGLKRINNYFEHRSNYLDGVISVYKGKSKQLYYDKIRKTIIGK